MPPLARDLGAGQSVKSLPADVHPEGRVGLTAGGIDEPDVGPRLRLAAGNDDEPGEERPQA